MRQDCLETTSKQLQNPKTLGRIALGRRWSRCLWTTLRHIMCHALSSTRISVIKSLDGITAMSWTRPDITKMLWNVLHEGPIASDKSTDHPKRRMSRFIRCRTSWLLSPRPTTTIRVAKELTLHQVQEGWVHRTWTNHVWKYHTRYTNNYSFKISTTVLYWKMIDKYNEARWGTVHRQHFPRCRNFQNILHYQGENDSCCTSD